MKSGIYAIKNNVNNKIYIGQSVNIRSRWTRHRGSLRGNRHENTHLQNSWNKYGEENFTFSVIEYVDIALLDEKELFYILKFDASNPTNGFNETVACESLRGWKHKDQTKLKISRGNKGKHIGELCGKAVLTNEDVLRIKEYLRDGAYTQYELSVMYNVDKSAISNIKTGDAWSHIVIDGFSESNKRSDSVRDLEVDEVMSIKKMIMEKVPQTVIAKTFNISQKYVSRIKREIVYADIKPDGYVNKNYNLTEEQKAEIRELLKSGVTAYRISKMYGISNTTLSKFKKKEMENEYVK